MNQLRNGLTDGQTVGQSAQSGLVVGAAEGEHLIHFRDHGKVFIKIGSAAGDGNLALGTQQVMAGSGIPTHRHFKTDEAF